MDSKKKKLIAIIGGAVVGVAVVAIIIVLIISNMEDKNIPYYMNGFSWKDSISKAEKKYPVDFMGVICHNTKVKDWNKDGKLDEIVYYFYFSDDLGDVYSALKGYFSAHNISQEPLYEGGNQVSVKWYDNSYYRTEITLVWDYSDNWNPKSEVGKTRWWAKVERLGLTYKD